MAETQNMARRIKLSCDVILSFGRRVRELRTAQCYSQKGFAVCGLDRTYMGGIERGERNVALRNIGWIAEALGISIAELMREI